MTDPHSQGGGWDERVDYDAPTRISGFDGQQSAVSTGSHPPAYPAPAQGYSQNWQDTSYGSNPQNGPYQNGPYPSGNGYYGATTGPAQPQGAQGQYQTQSAQYGQYGGSNGGPVPPGGPSPYAYPPGPAIPGVTVDAVTGEPLSDKSKVAAGFLQFFLGCFGAGRFYIGDSKLGAIQLGMFFVGLITAIFLVGFFILWGLSLWALVDAILMWTGSVRDAQGRKLR